MSPIDFIPKHSQPFTLEQAMLLEIDILVAGTLHTFPRRNDFAELTKRDKQAGEFDQAFTADPRGSG